MASDGGIVSAVTLSWGACTDKGLRRATNEDSFIADPPIFLVADGMGGHESGADASRIAIDGFRSLVGRSHATVAQVEESFERAVDGVDAIAAERFAAGTTLAGVALTDEAGAPYWLVLNIGDSRTYRFAAGALEQISVDHSAVQALVDRGELSAHDAESHPQRNVVTRAVGAGSSGAPDYWLLPASSGDRLVICSDGLTKELDDESIRRALADEPSAQTAATRLVHEALLHGGRDNVTVVVVDAYDVVEADDDPTRPGEQHDSALDEDTVPRAVASGEETRDARL